MIFNLLLMHSNPIVFCQIKKPFGCFQNFAPSKIYWNFRIWNTAEHLYQALKFQEFEIQEQIRLSYSPKEAKQIAYRYPNNIRKNWDQIKEKVMFFCLILKFTQNDDIKKILLSTKDLEIIEYSFKDYYWGSGQDFTGLNRLGNLIMDTRDFLNQNEALILHYNALVRVLNDACIEYYSGKPSTMTDAHYDKMFQDVVQIEKQNPWIIAKHSPTQRVGAVVNSNYAKVKHVLPMLSIKTSTDYTDKTCDDFIKAIQQKIKRPITYYAELKYDGLAIDLKYKDGILIQALTRGDGEIGEDVTHTVKTIGSIPLKLDHLYNPDAFGSVVHIRGEVMLPKKMLSIINEIRIKNNEDPYKNERNAAAGIIRNTDPLLAKQAKLIFIPYSIIFEPPFTNKIISQEDCIDLIGLLGFNGKQTNYSKLCSNQEELKQFYKTAIYSRPHLDFLIDGVVYKVNEFSAQKELGYNHREPIWAIAHKFEPEEAFSVVQEILVQVGRTGKLTPVAKIMPVFVGGVTVSSITLHNESDTRNRKVNIGAQVSVRRAGDVIPEICSSILNPNLPEFKMPTYCPECNGGLVQIGENHYCTNKDCPAQALAQFKHAVQKRAFNIQDLGEKTIEQLLDKGLIENLADLFCIGRPIAGCLDTSNNSVRNQLMLDVLKKLDRLGETSAENIVNSINTAKQMSLAAFIYGLGIPLVGESTAKTIASNITNIHDLFELKFRDLIAMDDIGDVTAEKIINYCSNKENKEIVDRMLNYGISFKTEIEGTICNGFNFVFSGTMPQSRQNFEKYVESQSGFYSKTVSKSTDYLVIGNEPSAAKVKAAQKNNTPIIDYNEFSIKFGFKL